MVKAKISKSKTFEPIVLTIETQEEYNFLRGMLSLGGYSKKEQDPHYDVNLDYEFFEVLKEVWDYD